MSLTDLRKAARAMGATVENHSGPRLAQYYIIAPPGKVWGCTGDTHYLMVHWNVQQGRPTWPEERDRAIQDAVQRISHGVTACDDPDCDWCSSEGEGL